MSQNSLVVNNGTGAQVRQAINGALDTLKTLNSGTTAPPNPAPGMLWVDTSATPARLKIRNTANTAWTDVGSIEGLDAKTLAGLAVSQLLRADIDATFNGNILHLTNGGVQIQFDDHTAPDSGGIKRITCNDGFGNWNFLAGCYSQGGALKYTTANSGAAALVFNYEGSYGVFDITTWPKGVNAGDPVTGGYTLHGDSNGVLNWGGVPLWHQNNVATQAEAEAGTNNTKGMTPLRVKQAIAALAPTPATWDFESISTPPTGTSYPKIISASHGLGVRPTLYEAYAVCTTATRGFSVGDEVVITAGPHDSTTVTGRTSLIANSTTIYLSIYERPYAISPTGLTATLDSGNFDVVLRAKK